MRIRSDGSIQSSSLPTYGNRGRADDFAIYRAMVTKVIYSDDARNLTSNAAGSRVLYEVVVLGGFAQGQIISNCRLASSLGGQYNYFERVLRAASKPLNSTPVEKNDGDIVYVQFIQGQIGYPVIIALDNGVSPELKGATKAQGQSLRWQYNGIYAEVDKAGDLTLIRKGGKYDANAQTFVPSKNTKNVELKISNQKIEVTLQNGLKFSVDGSGDKIEVISKKGTKIVLDGNADSVSVETSGGAKLGLEAGKVALGASGIEILDKIAEIADLVGQWASSTGSSHTHIGNLGYPTAPPDQAGAYSTLGSDLAAVKSDIDGIKGSL